MAFGKKKESGEKSDLVAVGALWPSKSGNGFNGSFNRDTGPFEAAVAQFGLDGLRFVVFANSFAKKDTDPSHKIYVSPKQAKGGFSKKAAPVQTSDDEETVEEAAKPAKKAKSKLPWDQD